MFCKKHDGLCTLYSVQLGFQIKESALLNHFLKPNVHLSLKTKRSSRAKLILNFLILSKIYSNFFKRFFKTFQKFAQDFSNLYSPIRFKKFKILKNMRILRGSISKTKCSVKIMLYGLCTHNSVQPALVLKGP